MSVVKQLSNYFCSWCFSVERNVARLPAVIEAYNAYSEDMLLIFLNELWIKRVRFKSLKLGVCSMYRSTYKWRLTRVKENYIGRLYFRLLKHKLTDNILVSVNTLVEAILVTVNY